ncbi:MAG: efflux RND transporter permease subunit [Bacteroidales bacterium]
MNLATYSLKNQKIIFFFLAILLLGGVMAFDKLGKKEDSPFVIKQCVLITQYPGATPEEVEQLITEPIEREIQSMRRVYRIKSDSYYGMSKISIELLPSTPAEEIPQMWDELRRKVLNIQPKLPTGASAVSVGDDFGDVFGIYYTLTAEEGFTYSEMRNWAEEIKTRIVTVDGVQKVTLFGDQYEVVNVFMSSAKLANLGVSTQIVAQTISSQNQLVNSGMKQAGDLQLKIVADGTYKTLDDIRNQLIKTNTGQFIRLGDIADIEIGYMDPPSNKMRVNGKRAIGIGVSTDPERDVVKAGELVSEKLDEVLSQLPAGLEIMPLYPEDVIAKEANNGFIINLIESVLIVVVIIMLVMGMRAGLLIGSSLVFSIGGTLLIMQFINVGLNRTSLAGFIIAMGMLVDNAIVVTDNAQISIRRGVERSKALIDGATVPQWGLLGATFIAICSFLPLYLAPSAVAEIVKPLFIVLAISLFLSWVLALTQTPVFGNFILKSSTGDSSADPYDTKFYHKFESVLRALISKRWLTISGAVIAFFVAMTVMGLMPQNFFPNLDKPYYRADLFWEEGYSIKAVEREVMEIESDLLAMPEVKTVSVTMGASPLRYYLASSSIGPSDNFANILVELHDQDNTKEHEEQFERYIREKHPNILVRSSLFKLSPLPESAIEIGFTGPNVDTLEMLTNQAMEIMERMPEVDNIRNSWRKKAVAWLPTYSQEKGQLLGVTRQSLAQAIKVATDGMAIGEYRQLDRTLPILIKDKDIDGFSLNNLKTIPVFTSNGNTVPLEQVTENLDYDFRYNMVRRFNRQRIMMAQCDPARGVNGIAAFNAVLDRMQSEISLPEGYSMRYLGEREEQDNSNSALAENMPLTFMLIFITLLFLFRNYVKPGVILMMIPLIFIGVVFGLVVMGKSFDFFAILGVLGLIGMNIKNAIVLVDQIEIEVNAGLAPLDAVVEATKSRIVPVVMASGTTILGMTPLLFDAMFGGMAATIMGGLLVASILTLFVLPVTYCAMLKIKG